MNLLADDNLGGLINNDVNFQNMGNLILGLIIVSTGGDWPNLMNDYQNILSNQCQSIKNPTYDISYVVQVDLLYLKLFIVIINKDFHDITGKDNKLVNSDHSDHFVEIRSDFDTNVRKISYNNKQQADTFIRCKNYGKLLIYLGEPFGLDQSYDFYNLQQEECLALVYLLKYNYNKDFKFMDHSRT